MSHVSRGNRSERGTSGPGSARQMLDLADEGAVLTARPFHQWCWQDQLPASGASGSAGRYGQSLILPDRGCRVGLIRVLWNLERRR